ncbi:MAG: flippase-like domain-containing protein, partial [Clostridia bacterium]|nr:flippase-like domain-containing protein [Clostridia bacterium]
GSSLIVCLIGMFYSNITPGASGGQPMQVYAYKKRGVPSGYASSGLAVKFFSFQTALLISTAVLWFLNRDFVRPHITTSRWFVYYGIAFNALGVIAVVLIAINKNIVRGFITFILKIGAKLHLIRDLPRTASRMDATLEDFNGSVSMLVHHPFHLLLLTSLSLVQIAGLMGGLYFVARAVGVDGYSYWQLTTLSHLLYMGAAFTPLPGGSGAQEGGFYLFFQNIFPADTLLAALLLWRFFNYYLSLLITLVFGVVLDSSLSMRGKIRKVQFSGAAGARIEEPDGEEKEDETDAEE